MVRTLTLPAGADAGFRTPARPARAASLLARVVAALTASRQRQAEAEVERYVVMNGGVLTDQLERDISRHYGNQVGGGWSR